LRSRGVPPPPDILTALPAAVAAARTGGPAVLLLPKDVQQGQLGADASATSGSGADASATSGSGADASATSGWGADASATSGANGHAHHRSHRAGDIGHGQPAPRPGDPRGVARLLRRARGPVTIIAGEQVARDDARAELEALRAALRARVATVPDAKDVSGSPGLGASSALGVTGVMGHPGVAAAVAGSAVCLLVGTRLSVTAGAGLDDALSGVQTISLGSAPPYRPCTHIHTDDLRGSLAQLTLAMSGDGRPTGLRVPDPAPRGELTPPAFDGPGIRYRDAIAALDAVLPDGADVVVDAGNTGAAAIHHLPVRRGGRFVVALGMGGMGYSFGAGIGMAFARAKSAGPSRRTVVIAGDGAFFMHGMELHTAIQYQLPVTFVLFNNNAHAMCVTREQLYYDGLYSYNRFSPSRLGAGLAAMFPGLPSVDIADLDAMPGALRAALQVEGPSVISVECSADEFPPFAPFLNDGSLARTSLAQTIPTMKGSHSDVVASA
jgi:acetolactate synthase I/II/III large subunit